MFELGYGGELKFIKEHNKVFIYTIIEDIDNLEQIDPKDWKDED